MRVFERRDVDVGGSRRCRRWVGMWVDVERRDRGDRLRRVVVEE